MTTNDTDNSNGLDDKVLYVRWSPFLPVAHVVSAETVAAAKAADDAPVLVDFGDLRRSGDLAELSYRLEQNGARKLDDYVAAIERSAGSQPTGGDLGERLASLDGVVFEGVAEGDYCPDGGSRFLPADDVDFRQEWEIDEAPDDEYRGYVVVAKAMSSDIPTDIFEEFCQASYGDSPAFSDHIDDQR